MEIRPITLRQASAFVNRYRRLGQILTEQEWVKLLYKMRGCEVTQEVLDGIYVEI